MSPLVIAGQVPTTVTSLDAMVRLADGRGDCFVRWTVGPRADADADGRSGARTGIGLAGPCASALSTEPWWDDRPLRVWVARRLHHHRPLRVRARAPRPGTRGSLAVHDFAALAG